jgi:hypothetical protein
VSGIVDIVRPAPGESARPFGNFCPASVALVFVPVPVFLLLGALIQWGVGVAVPAGVPVVHAILVAVGMVILGVVVLSFLSIYVRTVWAFVGKGPGEREGKQRSTWFAVFPPE